MLHWFNLSSSSDNTQFLIHNKTSYTSKLFQGELVTGGCGGWYSTYRVGVGVTSAFFLLFLPYA